MFCEWVKTISLTIVTFDNVEAAQRALATLNGQDIYAGCCTLKIDYSKVLTEICLCSHLAMMYKFCHITLPSATLKLTSHTPLEAMSSQSDLYSQNNS